MRRNGTERNGAESTTRRCACSGNSYGLDSLIKFSIHIHSFARRKSIQVASSLPVASFVGRTWVGREKRVRRVSRRASPGVEQFQFSLRYKRSNVHIRRFPAPFLSENSGQFQTRPFYGRVKRLRFVCCFPSYRLDVFLGIKYETIDQPRHF